MNKDKSFLHRLRANSVARAKEDFKTYDGVGLLYFSTALAGELGELCNLIKKLERHSNGGPDVGNSIKVQDITKEKLAEEIGGGFIYLDLVAAKLGIDLEPAVTDTFNAVSNKIGSGYRL